MPDQRSLPLAGKDGLSREPVNVLKITDALMMRGNGTAYLLPQCYTMAISR